MVIERDYDKTALLPTHRLHRLRLGRETLRPHRLVARRSMAMSNAWYRGVYKPFDEEKKRVRRNMKSAEPIQFIETAHQPRYYFADQMRDHRRPPRLRAASSPTAATATPRRLRRPRPRSFPRAASCTLRETANTATHRRGELRRRAFWS